MLCHTRDKWNCSVRTFARHQMLPTDKACLQEHLHEVKVQTQQHNTWKHNLSWTLLETHMGQGMQCRSWDIDLFWPQNHFSWLCWEVSWCLPRCCWSGISCCSVWMALHQTQWETSRNSKRCHFCTRDSTWSIWGRSWRTLAHRSGMEVSPWERRREGGRLSRSRRLSPRAGI